MDLGAAFATLLHGMHHDAGAANAGFLRLMLVISIFSLTVSVKAAGLSLRNVLVVNMMNAWEQNNERVLCRYGKATSSKAASSFRPL